MTPHCEDGSNEGSHYMVYFNGKIRKIIPVTPSYLEHCSGCAVFAILHLPVITSTIKILRIGQTGISERNILIRVNSDSLPLHLPIMVALLHCKMKLYYNYFSGPNFQIVLVKVSRTH